MALIFWIIIGILTAIAIAFPILPLMFKKYRCLKTAIFISLVLPIFSLLVYKAIGDDSRLFEYLKERKQSSEVAKVLSQFKSPLEVIDQLKIRLEAHPDSAKGWYLLGRLYLDQQYYQKANLALKKANQLSPNDPVIMTAYAEALFFTHNRLLDSTSSILLQQVIKINSNDVDALNMLAIGAYNAGQYQQAIGYWEKILSLLSSESSEHKIILQMLAKAHKQKLVSNKTKK